MFAGTNIFFLKSDSLPNYKNIFYRLSEISMDCSGIFDVCQGRETCQSYVGMYVNDLQNLVSRDNPVQLLNEYYSQNIQAYVIILLFPDMIEIYDLCTKSEIRGQGKASQILDGVLSLLDINEKAWLGIDINNPNFEEMSKFYAKKGFSSPYISDVTPSGKMVPLVFVGMIYDRVPSDPEKTWYQAIKIRNEYLSEVGICKTNLLIPYGTCKILYEYISKPTEYGGIFQPIGKQTVDGTEMLILDYPLDSEVQGQNYPLYAVEPPLKGPFNWHSHPEICYKDIRFLCYLGWPSGQDMAIIVMKYNLGLRVHFVITVEGIYAVQMTIPFVNAWNKIKNESCQNAIIYGIGKFFGETEKFRSITNLKKHVTSEDIQKLFTETQSKYDTFISYLHSVNTLTFEELIIGIDIEGYIPYLEGCVTEAGLTENFTLFQVNYMSWGDIEKSNGFFSLLTYLSTRKKGCDL